MSETSTGHIVEQNNRQRNPLLEACTVFQSKQNKNTPQCHKRSHGNVNSPCKLVKLNIQLYVTGTAIPAEMKLLLASVKTTTHAN